MKKTIIIAVTTVFIMSLLTNAAFANPNTKVTPAPKKPATSSKTKAKPKTKVVPAAKKPVTSNKINMDSLNKQMQDALKELDKLKGTDMIGLSIADKLKTQTDKKNTNNTNVSTKEPSKPQTNVKESSASVVNGLYKYKDQGNTIRIIRYIGSKSEVIIPDKINGKKVTSILESAFLGKASLKKVVFGSNIAFVGTGAFSNCSNLETVVFNQGLTELESHAFSNTGLISVDFPDTLLRIGFMCFAGNAPQILQKSFGEVLGTSLPQLKTVEIGNTATGFDGGDWARSGMNKFFNIVANGKSNSRKAVTLTDKDFKYTVDTKGLTITAYLGNYSDIIIPDTIAGEYVRYIGKGAFADCGTLRSVKFGANVIEIGESAFETCGNLADVQFNYGLQYIQTAAFQNTQIKNLVFPSTMKLINCFAFNNVPTVVSLVLYGNAPKIGGDTFGINWWGNPMPKLKKMDIAKNASGFDSKYWQDRGLTAMASRMSDVIGLDKSKPDVLKTFDLQLITK
jgi:hypothetical protein